METRANYVLIGAFTLFGILAGLAFVLWLARFEIDRRFDYYDILFDNVSGLNRGGEVRYNGLAVGQVVDFDFDRADPTLVRVRIEVRADTPITADVEARLALQGVTGVSFVSLTSTDPEAPLLRDVAGPGIPVIRARPSPLEAIIEDAPDLLTESLLLIRQVSELFGPENQAAVNAILANVAQATGRLDTALEDFSDISQRVAEATEVLARFTDEIAPLADQARAVVARADQALAAATGALGEAETTFAGVNTLIEARLPSLIDQAETTLGEVGDGAGTLMAELARTAVAATERLEQAEAVIANAEGAIAQAAATLLAVQATAASVDRLVAGEGEAFLAEARAAAAASAARLEQLEATVVRAEAALAEASAALRAVQATATSIDGLVTGEGAAFLAEARTAAAAAAARLAQLETTVERAEAALDQTVATLAAVEGTAGSIDTLVTTEGEALARDVRVAVRAATETLASVRALAVEDLPQITADVRSAAATVNAVLAEVGDDISRIGSDVAGFTGRLKDLADGTEGTIEAAASAFRTANTTLETVDQALYAAERTLTVAEQTFQGANRVIDEELEGIIADFRSVAGALEGALADVSEDLPAITAELRVAVQNAGAAMQALNAAVEGAAPPVAAFAQTGLPQFDRLAQEARALVRNLERLTARIERDPARFFLGAPAAEFRR